MTLMDEFKSRNFSIYGQWTGVLCIILCFALGLSNLIRFDLVIIFGVFSMVFSFIIVFIEIPLLLRICPTSSTFDAFIRRFATNYTRAGIYLVMSIVMWLSLIVPPRPTSLVANAVFLLFAAAFYALAALKGQEFQSSKTLGGHGVAQMIV